METLKEACGRGVVVVAITQFMKGSVSDAYYETGRSRLQSLHCTGGDMTPEFRLFLLFRARNSKVSSLCNWLKTILISDFVNRFGDACFMVFWIVNWVGMPLDHLINIGLIHIHSGLALETLITILTT